MEEVKVLHHLIVMVMCFMCFGFILGMCSDSDVLIKSYVSSSLRSDDLVDSAKLQVLPPITTSDWDSLVGGSKIPVVVIFTAEWCIPCRIESTILNSLVSDFTGRSEFYSLDVYEESVVAARYRIQTLPTIIVFKGGDVRDTLRGAPGRNILREFIEQNL